MKVAFKSIIGKRYHLISGSICAGAVLLVAFSAAAQNLFVASIISNYPGSDSGVIYEYTPGGASSTFASTGMLAYPGGLAFDNTGDLFYSWTVGVLGGGIGEITPGGARSTFAPGPFPLGALAFNSAGDLFFGGTSIYEITPGGVQSIFASVDASALAFDSSGDLFASSASSIYEFTPGGVKSTFTFGLDNPSGLAFNSAGDLFEADFGSGNIYEFTAGGVRTTFASGLSDPSELVFNSAGDLFEADSGSGNIYEFTPGGQRSTFASGIYAGGLAFQGVTLPVPEPSALGFLAVGLTALLVRSRHKLAA